MYTDRIVPLERCGDSSLNNEQTMKGSISGYVIYADNGDPIPRAAIKILHGPGIKSQSAMFTNGAGYFALNNVEEGEWVLSATSPTGQAQTASVSVFDDAVSSLTIEFPGLPSYMTDPEDSAMTGSVQGRVLSLEDEMPLSGVAITILRGPGSAPDLSALTNEAGGFELDGLSEGMWVIGAFGSAGGSGTSSVYVSPGYSVEILILLPGTSKNRQRPRATKKPPRNLEGHWILKSGIGTQLLPNTLITAEFKDGKLSGSGGCNQYGASYTVEPIDQNSGKIQIQGIFSTEMFCSEEINTQEGIYLQALEQVREYNLTDEGLTLQCPPYGAIYYSRGRVMFTSRA